MAKYKKYRRPIPLGKKLGIAALAAVLVFFLVILVIKMMGLRYIELTRDDGTVVKFTGWISEVGTPVSGKLYFSDGVSASIEDDGKTLVYSDGVRYTGEISAAYRRHGQGTITLANGDVYSGTFVNDAITGSGVYTFPNGDVYEGNYYEGMRSGLGRYTYSNGNYYEGSFVNGAMAGQYLAVYGNAFTGTHHKDIAF